MKHKLFLGAINKITGEYIYPKIAIKKDEYICPECKKDLILCKGRIRIHHFRHKVDTNPCNYYDKPSESQIHKDAKMLMKHLLENKIQIQFIRKCVTCDKQKEIKLSKVTEKSMIVLEYGFKYNNQQKYADVAHIINNELDSIYEICYKHKTSFQNRPEPWIEIDAESLLDLVNTDYQSLTIPCIRQENCINCIIKDLIKEADNESTLQEIKERFKDDLDDNLNSLIIIQRKQIIIDLIRKADNESTLQEIKERFKDDLDDNLNSLIIIQRKQIILDLIRKADNESTLQEIKERYNDHYDDLNSLIIIQRKQIIMDLIRKADNESALQEIKERYKEHLDDNLNKLIHFQRIISYKYYSMIEFKELFKKFLKKQLEIKVLIKKVDNESALKEIEEQYKEYKDDDLYKLIYLKRKQILEELILKSDNESNLQEIIERFKEHLDHDLYKLIIFQRKQIIKNLILNADSRLSLQKIEELYHEYLDDNLHKLILFYRQKYDEQNVVDEISSSTSFKQLFKISRGLIPKLEIYLKKQIEKIIKDHTKFIQTLCGNCKATLKFRYPCKLSAFKEISKCKKCSCILPEQLKII